MRISEFRPVYTENGRLYIIDQRALPGAEIILELSTVQDAVDAIKSLAVRGAPAIGITAAYALARHGVTTASGGMDRPSWIKSLKLAADELKSARPTAYNLFYAVDRVMSYAGCEDTPLEIARMLFREAEAVHAQDLETSALIAQQGVSLLAQGSRVLTICNAGMLATGGGGTALAPVYLAHGQGLNVHVTACETRPLLQGARLTSWELARNGVPHRLVCDSMAGALMARGEIDIVIVGADRVARNGDFANKIGTYSLAVLARYHKVPFYTAAPLSTFDFDCADGGAIPIEERDGNEVRTFQGHKSAPDGVPVYNPSFDVTPHALLSGIITEKGILKPPFSGAVSKLARSMEA